MLADAIQQYGITTIVTVAAISTTLLGVIARRARRKPTPPGPESPWLGFGQPFVPASSPWFTYQEWQKLYGDIVFYYAFGSPVAVINSAKVADDLLDKRGAVYSSRPLRTMSRELMGWTWSLAGMPYGSDWRKYRTAFQKHFNPRATTRYEPLQLKEVQTFLRNLRRTPDNYYHHMRRNAAALVMKINYDHDIADEGDYYVALADRAMNTLVKVLLHGSYAVDNLPILKYVPSWFPGAEFKKQAKEWRKDSTAMLEKPFEMVKRRMAEGIAGPCITTIELEDAGKEKTIDVQMIQGITAVSYAAGADTTVAAIMSFIRAAMNDPSIQRKAQEEIDRIVGSDRLPTFEDRNAMPYVTGIVWESLRWNPVAPLALTHRTTADDVYGGYYIPKGTTVIPNVWGMLHDETKYPDAFKFNPERYADEKKNAQLGINELPQIAFGFGRRVCPGRWLALDTVWVTIASTLAVYNIEKPKDANGIVIEQPLEFTGAAVSRPKDFKCSFVPRSADALALFE